MGRRNKIIEKVEIHGLAHKGFAVGKTHDGMIVFAEGCVPGDQITFKSTRKKKSFLKGYALEVTRASEDRISAPCSHFGDCGGCKWQNLAYSSQLEHKEQIVRDALEKIADVHPNDIQFLPIKGMVESPFAYRNKMEFSFSHRRWITNEEIKSGKKIDQHRALGLHRPRAYDKIVDIHDCHLIPEVMNGVKNGVREFTQSNNYSYFDQKKQSGLLRALVLRVNLENELMVMPVFSSYDEEKVDALLGYVRKKFPAVKSLHYMINPKKNDDLSDLEAVHWGGESVLRERFGEIVYEIGPKSFFQTNSLQGKVLYDMVSEFADLKGNELVYDLYTGIGSIALYLSSECRSVVGIEKIPEAIEDAVENARINGIENARFEVGDVKALLDSDFIEKHGAADLVVTDPPRAGMHPKVVETLLESGIEKIIYVSCNPSTMARDIALLQEKYDLAKCLPVDMFPHTGHIECVNLLKLKS